MNNYTTLATVRQEEGGGEGAENSYVKVKEEMDDRMDTDGYILRTVENMTLDFVTQEVVLGSNYDRGSAYDRNTGYERGVGYERERETGGLGRGTNVERNTGLNRSSGMDRGSGLERNTPVERSLENNKGSTMAPTEELSNEVKKDDEISEEEEEEDDDEGPTEYPCVVCRAEVTNRSHALCCDKCSKWQHRKCKSGVSAEDYRALVAGDIDLDWNCFTCSPPARKKGSGAGKTAVSRKPAAKPPAVPPAAPVYRSSQNKQQRPSSKRSPDKVYNYSDQDSSDDERPLHIASPPSASKDTDDSSDDSLHGGKTKKESPRGRKKQNYWLPEVGKVVQVVPAGKVGEKDNWFPGLVVVPSAQKTLKVEPKTECLVRSFMDGRFHVVLKTEVEPFERDSSKGKDVQGILKRGVSKAVLFLTDAELPSTWDANQMFGQSFTLSPAKLKDKTDKSNGGQMSPKKSGPRGRPIVKKKAKRKGYVDTSDESETDSEAETAVERDHFAAQLYNYMDQCGTPIVSEPTIAGRDLDLHRLYKVVHSLGGLSRVQNQNMWHTVADQMALTNLGDQAPTLLKENYKRYLESFDQFYRKLGGLSLLTVPRGSRTRQPSQDSATSPPLIKKESLSPKKDIARPKKDSPTSKKSTPKTEKDSTSLKKDSQSPKIKKETPIRKKETPASRKETPPSPKKEPVNARKATLASRKEPIGTKKDVQQPGKDIPPSPTKASMKRSRSISQDEEKNRFKGQESSDSDSSDDEPTEEKDYFVAQLYMFMESRKTPINKAPTVGGKDVDLYKLYKVVERLGGSNIVNKKNLWRSVTNRMHLQFVGVQAPNLISAAYKRFLESFEASCRKLGSSTFMASAGQRSGRTATAGTVTKEPDNTPHVNKSASERKTQVKKETKSEPDDSFDDSDRDSDESPLMTKNATEISPPAKKDVKKQVKEEDDMDDYSDDESDSEISDEEILQERDHFVAHLYKFMEERGTPINKGPTVGGKDIDLYRLYNVVTRMGGFNKVTNQKKWKVVTNKMGLQFVGAQAHYLIKATYKRFLEKFETFYRKLGLNPTMLAPSSEPRASARSTRVLSRDLDSRSNRVPSRDTDRSPNSVSGPKDVKKELKKDSPKVANKETIAAKDKKKEPEKITLKGAAKDAGSNQNIKDNKNGGKNIPLSDEEESDDDSSDEETPEEKDHFVAQLYKFMEESGSPINSEPRIARKDLDLFRLYKVVNKLGGSSRVNNQNLWREVMEKMDLSLGAQGPNQVKQAFKRYLENFDTFNRKLGCTVFSSSRDSAVATPGTADGNGRPPRRSMIRRLSNTKKDSSSEDKDDDSDETDTESGSDDHREEKENFVSQLYKFMEESGSPILKSPTIGRANLDLYQLFNVVRELGGFSRVMNQNQWLEVANKMDLKNVTAQTPNLLRAAYKRYLESYEKNLNKHGNSSVISHTVSRESVVTHETILYPGGSRTESITPTRGAGGRVARRQAPQKEMKDIDSSEEESEDDYDSPPQSTNKPEGSVERGNARRPSRQSLEEGGQKSYKDLSDGESVVDLSYTSDESKKKTTPVNIKKQPNKRIIKKKDNSTSDEDSKVVNTQVPKKRGPVARKQPVQKEKINERKEKVNERKSTTAPVVTKRTTTQTNARRLSSKIDNKVKSKEYISDDDSDDSTSGSPISKPKLVNEIKPPILKDHDNKLDESSDDSEGRLVISSSPPKPKINNNARKAPIRKVGSKLSSEDDSNDSDASLNSKKIVNNSRRTTIRSSAPKESLASKRATVAKENKKSYNYSSDDSEEKGSNGSYGVKREAPQAKLQSVPQTATSPKPDNKMIYDFSDDDSDDDRLVISDIVKKPKLDTRNIGPEKEKKNIDIYSNEESDDSDASDYNKKITTNSRKTSNQKEKKIKENISDSDESDDNSDDDAEAKDSFVAQLYSFTESSGNPINEDPKVGDHDLDLYRLYKVVGNAGGVSRVNNQNLWPDVSSSMGFAELPGDNAAQIKAAYRKYLEKFEIFQRKLGCSIMKTNPGGSRSSRSLNRETDRSPRGSKRKHGNGSSESSEGENEIRKKKGRKHFLDERYFKKNRRKNNENENSSTAAVAEVKAVAVTGTNLTKSVVDTATAADAASVITSGDISYNGTPDKEAYHHQGQLQELCTNIDGSPLEIQQEQQHHHQSGSGKEDPKDMATEDKEESSKAEPFLMLKKLTAKQISHVPGDPKSTASINHKQGSAIFSREVNQDVAQNEGNDTEIFVTELHHAEAAQCLVIGQHSQSKSLIHHKETIQSHVIQESLLSSSLSNLKETTQSSTVGGHQEIITHNATITHNHADQPHAQENRLQCFVQNNLECRECKVKFMTRLELSGHRCKKIAAKPYKWTAVVLNRDP